jgi:hypothetical protein
MDPLVGPDRLPQDRGASSDFRKTLKGNRSG